MQLQAPTNVKFLNTPASQPAFPCVFIPNHFHQLAHNLAKEINSPEFDFWFNTLAQTPDPLAQCQAAGILTLFANHNQRPNPTTPHPASDPPRFWANSLSPQYQQHVANQATIQAFNLADELLDNAHLPKTKRILLTAAYITTKPHNLNLTTALIHLDDLAQSLKLPPEPLTSPIASQDFWFLT